MTMTNNNSNSSPATSENKQNNMSDTTPFLLLSASIENPTDYTNLFRGLSTFEMNFNEQPAGQKGPAPDEAEKEPEAKSDEEEKSFDIELLLREQQHKSTAMGSNDRQHKTLTELSPVKMCISKENSFITYDDSSNCSTSTNQSTRGGRAAPAKRKLDLAGSIPHLDLVSSGSGKTPLGPNNSEPPVKQVKRGRKPLNSSCSGPGESLGGSKSKYCKEEHDSKTLVYFGNKKVEKDTDEYKVRRSSNNEAVKRCREKAEREQREREGKMKTLQEENSKLTDKVSSLSKEVDVLRGIIITMRSDKQLPTHIHKLLGELNQT